VANYLRPQTVGDVLRNVAEIYGRNFGVIFLTYLPFSLIQVLQTEAQLAVRIGAGPLGLLSLLFYVIAAWVAVACFAIGPLTVAVSDICLGNKPSVARSYGKVFGGLLGKLFVATLLQTLFIFIGLILLILPGVLAMLWLLLTPSVVVLEGLGGMKALKRSKALGQGYNWRNLGIILLLQVLSSIPFVLFALLMPNALGQFGGRLLFVALQSLTGPLTVVVIVLLYYDLRVRKEAYDAAALAEDLRR